MSAINASSSGLTLQNDLTGNLYLQTSGVNGLTLSTTGAIGIGSTPNYGSNYQILTSTGSSSVPTWQAGGIQTGKFTAIEIVLGGLWFK